MKVTKETEKTINMVQDFLRDLQKKETQAAEKSGEFMCSGHLGNMIFKLNLVKEELGIEKPE